MFLRCKTRHKDGKSHRYWSVVENRRVGGGRIVQRHVLYLGEINDGQAAAWRRRIEVLADGEAEPQSSQTGALPSIRSPHSRASGFVQSPASIQCLDFYPCYPDVSQKPV
jgi:hypothetical protein